MKHIERLFPDSGIRHNVGVNSIFLCILFVLGLVLDSCSGGGSKTASLDSFFKDPSATPVKGMLKTGVPLGYASSAAMSAVTGTTPSNVHTSAVCSSYPCSATVTITDDNSAMPLQLGDFGTITVYGYWTSADDALLTVVFGQDAGTRVYPVHNISVFPVSRTGTGLEIVYTSMDINAAVTDPGTLQPSDINDAFNQLTLIPSTNAGTNVGMAAWVIETDDKSTGDVSDDVYSISGGGQFISAGSGSASVLQLGLSDVVMGPDCKYNPASGDAVLQEVAYSSSNELFGQAVFSFHQSCDGEVDIVAGNGNYLLSTGSAIPLYLYTP